VVCHGKACNKGTHIMASAVPDDRAASQSPDGIVQLYPTLRREAVIAYAAELAREGRVLVNA